MWPTLFGEGLLYTTNRGAVAVILVCLEQTSEQKSFITDPSWLPARRFERRPECTCSHAISSLSFVAPIRPQNMCRAKVIESMSLVDKRIVLKPRQAVEPYRYPNGGDGRRLRSQTRPLPCQIRGKTSTTL